jgi:hypothetical protein
MSMSSTFPCRSDKVCFTLRRLLRTLEFEKKKIREDFNSDETRYQVFLKSGRLHFTGIKLVLLKGELLRIQETEYLKTYEVFSTE